MCHWDVHLKSSAKGRETQINLLFVALGWGCWWWWLHLTCLYIYTWYVIIMSVDFFCLFVCFLSTWILLSMFILLWVIISNKLMAISPVKIQFPVFEWTKFSYKGIFLQNKRSDIWVHWSTGMLYKLYIQNACHVWKDSRHIIVVAFLLLLM